MANSYSHSLRIRTVLSACVASAPYHRLRPPIWIFWTWIIWMLAMMTSFNSWLNKRRVEMLQFWNTLNGQRVSTCCELIQHSININSTILWIGDSSYIAVLCFHMWRVCYLWTWCMMLMYPVHQLVKQCIVRKVHVCLFSINFRLSMQTSLMKFSATSTQILWVVSSHLFIWTVSSRGSSSANIETIHCTNRRPMRIVNIVFAMMYSLKWPLDASNNVWFFIILHAAALFVWWVDGLAITGMHLWNLNRLQSQDLRLPISK